MINSFGLRETFLQEKCQIFGKIKKYNKTEWESITWWSSHRVSWTNGSLDDVLRTNGGLADILWLSSCVHLCHIRRPYSWRHRWNRPCFRDFQASFFVCLLTNYTINQLRNCCERIFHFLPIDRVRGASSLEFPFKSRTGSRSKSARTSDVTRTLQGTQRRTGKDSICRVHSYLSVKPW